MLQFYTIFPFNTIYKVRNIFSYTATHIYVYYDLIVPFYKSYVLYIIYINVMCSWNCVIRDGLINAE